MKVQDIQKHNVTDEGYHTRASTPINRTHLEDDMLDTTSLPELPITEENSELYETCQGEQDIEDELEGSEVMSELPLDGTIYEQVDERMKENISNVLEAIYQASRLFIAKQLTREQMIEEWIKSVELGESQKIMFGMPEYIFFEDLSIIDTLVYYMNGQKKCELSTDGRYQLDLLSSKISDLVLTGTYVSEEPLQFLPPDLIEKRSNYLSSLKQIVCDSIEKDGEENVIKDIIVERDNKLYCIQCPEASIVTPAKFLSNPEFQNLDGVLKIGEGDDVIRIQDGKYHDIKGSLQMTFPISNSEKIVMTLSSEKADKPENASSFGKIIVHMDDKSCEIFSKYLKELEKEPRISKVVEAAKSFVEERKGKQSEPFSVLEEVSISKCSHFNHQR
ncbi:hypothetical protein [Wolbachia endosymbiont of Aedes albopictus]|uniref:hypothetical protein n=1 Tax=Wolbachia endosymbiont of Aedes albopictus TaxID=167957 RepID=UPI000BBBEB35|nr:hypothetical protein [Wolbachia endosymbiont of Aedes albopictus]UVW83664.1 hypothetical protein NHG98_04810 [Wolbachia endosymbiont of Aedes albopictus]